MNEGLTAWWEHSSDDEVKKLLAAFPATIALQMAVACDMRAAPISSDQETFPTLEPHVAHKLLQKSGGIKWKLIR